MKVYELMEMLEEMNPDAEVEIVYQPHYPMAVQADKAVEVNGTVYIRQDPYCSNNYAPGAVYNEEEEEE